MRTKDLSSILIAGAVIFYVISFLSSTYSFADENIESELIPPETQVSDNLDWQEVVVDKKVNIYEMLANQTKGNYSKLRTWKGECLVHVKHALGETFVAQYLNLQDAGPLIQKADMKLNLVIDIPSNSYYRSKENSSLIFLEEETEKVVNIPNVHPINDRSVITSEHYIQFYPDIVAPGFHSLQGHPQAMNKRAAFRRPAGIGLRHSHGDFVDPLAFFGFSPAQRFWEGLGLYIPLLKGEGSAELVKKVKERISVFQANTKDGVSYKIVNKIGDDDSYYSTSIWSSSVGFNPISQLLSENKNGDNPFQHKTWKWKAVDGIFIPTYVYSTSHDRTSGKLEYHRTVKFEKSILNHPIDENQFSYQGLGMEEGELVKDDIENAFYIINDGGLKKLANFGEKYVPPGKVSDEGLSNRQWMLIVNLIFLIVLASFVFIKRRKMKAN
ncbi:hypothetical protein [Gimesia aquarii]|uniref:Uncharacterized protein n=1 Tax=Gimesia aquarii TaxID=2527964 RepID=A0A517W3Z1_9PLAN|nr:hypothetical protein [Gimesia aquarii]QDT99965.1 hypothetical protein V144x_54790 [Gimesia aquarii]